MGRKCSVKLCESNKSTEHITLFSIPKDQTLHEKWTSIVNAWNYDNTKVKYLCHKHFEANDINKTFDGFTIKDTQVLIYESINSFSSHFHSSGAGLINYKQFSLYFILKLNFN